MRFIYGLRFAGLAVSALTIAIGAVMVFKGLQGSFDWAFEAPRTLSAKLTNASPGIVFATIGMVLGFVVVLQKPVNYSTGGDGNREGLSLGTSPESREYAVIKGRELRKHADDLMRQAKKLRKQKERPDNE
jgi:ABC-type sulfate transport system permease subunit